MSADNYDIAWLDIPPGSLCKARLNHNTVKMLVRWPGRSNENNAAWVGSTSSLPMWQIKASSNEQGPACVVARGLTDEQCATLQRMAADDAAVIAPLVSLWHDADVIPWRALPPNSAAIIVAAPTYDAKIGWVVVRRSDGGAAFCGRTNYSSWWLHESENHSSGTLRILAKNLTEAQCEQLRSVNDFAQAAKLACKFAATAAKPTRVAVGQIVEWADVPPGTYVRDDETFREYLRWPGPDEDGDDCAELTDGTVGPYFKYPRRHSDLDGAHALRVVASGLTKGMCRALAMCENACDRWAIVDGGMVHITSIRPGTLFSSVYGWGAVLDGGKIIHNSGHASFDDNDDCDVPYAHEELSGCSDAWLRETIRVSDDDATTAVMHRVLDAVRSRWLSTRDGRWADEGLGWLANTVATWCTTWIPPQHREAAYHRVAEAVPSSQNEILAEYGIHLWHAAGAGGVAPATWAYWGAGHRGPYNTTWDALCDFLVALPDGMRTLTALAGQDWEDTLTFNDGSTIKLGDEDDREIAGRCLAKQVGLYDPTEESYELVDSPDGVVHLKIIDETKPGTLRGPWPVYIAAGPPSDLLVVWSFTDNSTALTRLMLAALAELKPHRREWRRQRVLEIIRA